MSSAESTAPEGRPGCPPARQVNRDSNRVDVGEVVQAEGGKVASGLKGD